MGVGVCYDERTDSAEFSSSVTGRLPNQGRSLVSVWSLWVMHVADLRVPTWSQVPAEVKLMPTATPTNHPVVQTLWPSPGKQQCSGWETVTSQVSAGHDMQARPTHAPVAD